MIILAALFVITTKNGLYQNIAKVCYYRLYIQQADGWGKNVLVIWCVDNGIRQVLEWVPRVGLHLGPRPKTLQIVAILSAESNIWGPGAYEEICNKMLTPESGLL